MGSERREADDIRLEIVVHPAGGEAIDRAIAALAARQHGVVAARQLAALGLTQRAVSHRATAGRLHRLHRGVYAVGHTRLPPYGHWMAAVLSAGPGAALSHAAAAALWEIRPSAATKTDVSVRTPGGRRGGRVRIHRAATLSADEVTRHHNIPVTTPARTLLDLAASLRRHALERALDRAEALELFDLTALDEAIDAHRGQRGSAALAAALEEYEAGTIVTRSALEDAFLALCAAQALERPRANVRVAGLEVDFYFAVRRLVVEVDGYRYHRSRRAFANDRARDAQLARAGYRTLRFTYEQVTDEATMVAATIRSSA